MSKLNHPPSWSFPGTLARYILEFLLFTAVTLGLLMVLISWNGSLFRIKDGDAGHEVILARLDLLQTAISQRSEPSTTTFTADASSADSIPMQDFALITSGAFPIPPLTSMFDTTLRLPSWHMWRRTPDQHSFEGHSAKLALTANLSQGSCWKLPETRGYLGIGFKTPVIITHISIEHLPSQSGSSVLDAPRDIVFWGFVEHVENLRRYRSFNPSEDDQPPEAVIVASRRQNPAGSFIKLAHVEYSLHDFHVQTFPVHESVLRSGFDFGLVVVEIRSNWGAAETCLYRVRVHGREVHELLQVGL